MNENVPPVPSTPPPLLPVSRPPRRSRGRGWLWLTVGAGAFLLVAVMVAVPLARSLHGIHLGTRTAHSSRRTMHEVVVEDNDSRNKLLIIDVEGVISSQPWDRSGRSMVESVSDQLKAAAEDDHIKAVILKVDSPGGEVLASDDIYRKLAEFQEESDKPVIAAMGGMAASGGYYVSAACRWIVANELTITGSIGVIMHSFNYRGLLDKVGVYPQVFKSGKFKDMLSGTKTPGEIDPKEREMLQSMIDETFQKFKSVVSEGRGRAAKANQGEGRELVESWVDHADGRVLTGKQAHDLGFVDELGSFEVAVDRAKKLAAIEEGNLIRYEEPFDLSHLFGIFGKSESKNIKLDLGIDLPKLQAGRIYFLSPTFVH